MSTALITGASSGIGYAFSEYYASIGFDIVLISNQEEDLIRAANFLENKFHIQTFMICIDLSNTSASKKIIQYVEENDLDIDVLVNAAGFGIKGKFANSSIERIHQLMNVHMTTTTDLTYYVLKRMVEKNSGTMINIASVSAYNPAPYNAVYAACKSYILSLTSAIHYEYKDTNLKIIAVCPMATKTHFFDNFPTITNVMRKPEDVVKTTMKALKKNKIMAVDGFLGKFQAIIPHFGTMKMRTYINGFVCRKWENY